MRCPNCSKEIYFEPSAAHAYPHGDRDKATKGFDVAHGFCPSCTELIVVVREGKFKNYGNPDRDEIDPIREEIIVYPKNTSGRILPPEVPAPYRDAYTEAEAVIAISPKASAALSRRLLQAVLRDHFKIPPSSLVQEVQAFLGGNDIPSYISEALDAVRTIGNFAAHPLKDTNTGIVLDVDPGEAEWLLETLESLFDFAFVQPIRIKKRREDLDRKLSSARRRTPESEAEPPDSAETS